MTAKRPPSRWGEGLEGQRLPGYRIVLTEETRHGKAKRWTFLLDEDSWDEPGGLHWIIEPDRWKITERAHRAGYGTHDKPLNLKQHGLAREPIPPVMHLARGLDVPREALTTILDALVSAAKHELAVADIKKIISQLGRRLVAFNALTEDQRQHAESAVFVQILSRCPSTMGIADS